MQQRTINSLSLEKQQQCFYRAMLSTNLIELLKFHYSPQVPRTQCRGAEWHYLFLLVSSCLVVTIFVFTVRDYLNFENRPQLRGTSPNTAFQEDAPPKRLVSSGQ
jgi:hypothetical protein